MTMTTTTMRRISTGLQWFNGSTATRRRITTTLSSSSRYASVTTQQPQQDSVSRTTNTRRRRKITTPTTTQLAAVTTTSDGEGIVRRQERAQQFRFLNREGTSRRLLSHITMNPLFSTSTTALSAINNNNNNNNNMLGRRGFTVLDGLDSRGFLSLSSSSSFFRLYSTTGIHQKKGEVEEGDTTGGGNMTKKKSKSDASAASQSRAPFGMPSNSPNDSALVMTIPPPQDDTNKKNNNQNAKGDTSSSSSENGWERLGLWPELAETMIQQHGLQAPTSIQATVIPKLLHTPMPSTLFVAATGSGKTLAYTLPLLQHLKQSERQAQEASQGNVLNPILRRRPKRPRALILAPTRELATQISSVIKSCCHTMKLSSRLLIGGQQGTSGGEWAKQRVQLNRPVDILVATPGRLLQHWKEENVITSTVEYVILDEMDTLLEQGFANELKELLYPLLYKKNKKYYQEIDVDKDYKGFDTTSTGWCSDSCLYVGHVDTGCFENDGDPNRT